VFVSFLRDKVDFVADRVKDVAPFMTDFTDLCNFQEDFVPDFQPSTDRKRQQINTFPHIFVIF